MYFQNNGIVQIQTDHDSQARIELGPMQKLIQKQQNNIKTGGNVLVPPSVTNSVQISRTETASPVDGGDQAQVGTKKNTQINF